MNSKARFNTEVVIRQNRPRRALVTGATGFVGSHLSKRLVDESWQTHVITRPESDVSILGNYRDRLSLHTYGGTTDEMIGIVSDANPDIVFHLASLFLAEHSSDDIVPMIRSNVVLGTQLVEAMSVVGSKALVNTGTSWQHYKRDEYSPVCLYAATKEAFSDILKYYVEAKSLDVITLKLFDTYGPRDPRRKLFWLLRNALREEEPLSMSEGRQLVDLVYIDDVVEAFICAGRHLLSGRTAGHEQFAVSSCNPIELREIVRIYEGVAGRRMNILWGGREYRNREVMIPWRDGKILPGWRYRTRLRDGIAKVLRDDRSE